MITTDEIKALSATFESQTEFASAAGVTQPTVSRWLRGTMPDPQQEERLRQLMGRPMPKVATPVVDLGVERARARAQGVRPAGIEPIALQELPKDVPVLGTAFGGEKGDFTFNGETIDYVRRPAGIATLKSVYSLYIENDSMYPRYEPGELIYVQSSRSPAIGDYVVIEMRPDHEEGAGPGFVKRLKKRTPTKIIVEQFNPAGEVEFDLREVKTMHRIIPTNELLGV